MTNDQLAQQWLDSNLAEGLAQSSVATYGDDIACYVGFLRDRGLHAASVTLNDLRDYLSSLDLANSTISHRRAVLGSFHRFLAEERIAQSNPAKLLSPLRRDQRIPKSITMDEVDRLLDTAHARAQDGSVGLYRQAGYARRAALLETLYASGMRISEAVSLQYAHIEVDHAQVVGKGQKERIILFNDKARTSIQLWKALAAAYQPGDRSWVFHGVRNYRKPLTRNAAFKEIKEAAQLSGIAPTRLSPHVLRHAFASHLLSNGVDLRVLQEMLGHADIASTEVYLHVLDHRKIGMVRDLHPMNDHL